MTNWRKKNINKSTVQKNNLMLNFSVLIADIYMYVQISVMTNFLERSMEQPEQEIFLMPTQQFFCYIMER